MTSLGQHIKDAAIRELQYWAAHKCKEDVPNGGPCVMRLIEQFGDHRREAWCAVFAWDCVDAACRELGVRNSLPHVAGAANMRDQSKKLLRVDSTPAIGAVMYRRSTSSSSSGHIGVVVQLASDGIGTVEGNKGDTVAYGSYSFTGDNSGRKAIDDPYWKFSFIHTEEMAGAEGPAKKLVVPGLAIATVATVTYLIGRHLT